MPSAHAIDREFRVLTALRGSAVPTPEPYLYCDDREVIGTPFYLMEWLDGRVFHEFATPGLRAARSARELYPLDVRDAGRNPQARLPRAGPRRLRQARQLFRAPAQSLVGAMERNSGSGDDDNPDLDRMVRWLVRARAGERDASRSVTAISASPT